MKVGGVTEVVTVTGDTETQIDLRSTTVAHNVTAEEFDRMPKARSFQSIALTSPGVNQGDIEGGFQVNGASGAENSFTVDGVTTNSLIYGSSRQDTRVRVPAGSPGQDRRHRSRVRRRARRRHQRGDQVGRQQVHRRRPLLLFGQPVSANPVQRLQLSPLDDTTVLNVQDDKQKNNRNEVGGSLGGPIMKDQLVLLRIGVAAIRPPHERLPLLERHRAGIDPAVADRDADVRQGDLFSRRRAAGERQRPLHAAPSTGTLSAYNGTGPNFISSSLAGNAAQIPRGFNQDQTNISGNVDFIAEQPRRRSACAAGCSRDNYKDTGVSTTTSVIWNTPSIGVAGVPANLQLPKGAQNTPRVHITNKDETKTGFFQARLQPRVQSRPARTC